MSKCKILAKFLIFFGFFNVLSTSSYAYWQIDQSEFNNFLCNTVREYKACSAPSLVGKFNTYLECESARKKILPNDIHWQRKTRCVGYDEKPASSYTQPQQPNYQEEIERYRQELILEQQESQLQKEQYLRELEQKRIQEIQRLKSLSYQMKTSPPPISHSQKEAYRKTLNQAHCTAYNLIQVSEMALKGNFEISENLLTDLERIREKAGEGFDDKVSTKCPKNLEFTIPEPKMSIEEDPIYKNYKEITQSVLDLFLEIQASFEEFKLNQEKKKEIQENTAKIENKLQNLKKKIKETKDPKKKREYNSLLAEAQALLQEAKNKYQEVLKNEEKLLKEKQEIENKLVQLKGQLLDKKD